MNPLFNQWFLKSKKKTKLKLTAFGKTHKKGGFLVLSSSETDHSLSSSANNSSQSATEFHPMYDVIFSRWMSNKVICESFLSSLLNKEIHIKGEIKVQETVPSQNVRKRGIRLDIEATDHNLHIYNIEAQRKYIAREHRDRCLYYACVQIANQLNKGDNFSDLKQTTIIFVNLHSDTATPFILEATLKTTLSCLNYNDKFRIIEVNLDKLDTDAMSSLCVAPDLKFLASFSMIGDDFPVLERYCKQHNIFYNQSIVEILHELFRDIRNDRTIIEAINLYKQIGEDIKEVELPVEIQKTLKEQGIVQGIAQGIEQGIVQGIVQGIEQGILQGKIAILLELGYSDQDICNKLKVSPDKINEIKSVSNS